MVYRRFTKCSLALAALLTITSNLDAQTNRFYVTDSSYMTKFGSEYRPELDMDWDTPSAAFYPVSYKIADKLQNRAIVRREKNDAWFRPSGWVEMGYAWNSSKPASGRNTPLGFVDQHQELQLNQLYLVLEGGTGKDDNESWSLDARVDLMFGTDHGFTTASGLEVRRDGSQRWNSTPDPSTDDDYRGTAGNPQPYYGLAMPQIYLDVHTPWLQGMDLRMGHFYTNVGYESVMPLENFFYTHTMSMMYGQPFTHTGMMASTKLFDAMDISFGFTRGWDNWEDDAEGDLSIAGGIGFNLEDNAFSVNFHSGDDFIGLDNDGNTLIGNVTIITLNYTRNVTDNLTHALTADVGYGDGMQLHTSSASLSGARWYGITNYLTYEVGEKLSTGLRVEWFRDQDNSRVMPGAFSDHVSGGNYVNVSLGLNYRHNDRWTFRPEARWDWSDTKSEDLSVPGVFGDFQENDTFTLSMDAIFTY